MKRLLELPSHYAQHLPKNFFRNNRKRFLETLEKSNASICQEGHLAFFQSSKTISVDDQDVEYPSQQEANFFYLFGVPDLDSYAMIDLHKKKSYVFIPKLPENLKIWMTIHPLDYYKEKYDVDQFLYIDELEDLLSSLNAKKIFLYSGIDSDSRLPAPLPSLEALKPYARDTDAIYELLNECRVVKSTEEIDQLKFINKISSEAHVQMMIHCEPGMLEYQLEAIFKFYHHFKVGAKIESYQPICASGDCCGILHYIDNDKVLKEGRLALLDCGMKFNGYCSDITTTIPVSGKFSQRQKEIYDAVLEANRAVLAKVRPGVKWDDMHRLAEEIIQKHLVRLGLIKDVDPQILFENRVTAIFFPHGLGHFLGLRVHDVGGYNKGCPERLGELGLKNLRTRRTLEEGMIITVEPGCYFHKDMIDMGVNDPKISPFLNLEKIKEYMEVGGVRIEDVIAVQKEGAELLTYDLPRTTEEIEECMKTKVWKQK